MLYNFNFNLKTNDIIQMSFIIYSSIEKINKEKRCEILFNNLVKCYNSYNKDNTYKKHKLIFENCNTVVLKLVETCGKFK